MGHPVASALALACAIAGAVAAGEPGPDARPRFPPAAYEAVALVGSLTNPAIREASGLAVSQVSPDVLWVLNDSGNPAEIYAVGTNGSAMATARIQGVRNRDWEDMASFSRDGVPYLLIADTGDNQAKHARCQLIVVREPSEADRRQGGTLVLPVAWMVTFRYEDGPRDCESVAVDAAAERVLLLSKRTRPPVLYEVPLLATGTTTVAVATRVTELPAWPVPERQDPHPYWTQPTAMAMAADGQALAVLTYAHIYVFERAAGDSWRDAVRRVPQCVLLPSEDAGILTQREALCFARQGRRLWVTGEGYPAMLGRLDRITPAGEHGVIPGR